MEGYLLCMQKISGSAPAKHLLVRAGNVLSETLEKFRLPVSANHSEPAGPMVKGSFLFYGGRVRRNLDGDRFFCTTASQLFLRRAAWHY